MGSPKKTKPSTLEKVKPVKQSLRNSKKSISKKSSRISKNKECNSRKVQKADIGTQNIIEPNCSSVNGSVKMSGPNSINKISMADKKCHKRNGSKNDLKNKVDSMDEKHKGKKSMKNNKRSIKSVSKHKKTKDEVPQNLKKYKRINTSIYDDLSSSDDSDIVKVKNCKPQNHLISSDDSDGDSNFKRNPKDEVNSGKNRLNKGLNIAAKPNSDKEVPNLKADTSNKFVKGTATYSTQQLQGGSKEEKPIKPESFLPIETMRLKPKKVNAGLIRKRRNTTMFPHICADDENEGQIVIHTTKNTVVDDAHEDGELSSSSSEFNDGYDENLMAGKLDYESLSKLSEIDRELEIFKRGEERELKKRRWEILRKLKKNKANKVTETSGRSLKRKVELEKVNAKNQRSTAMAELVKQREKKLDHENCTADDKSIPEEDYEILPMVSKRPKSTVKLKASDIYSDESWSEGENIVEVKPATPPVIIPSITTVQELNQIFISRTNMEKLLYLPNFYETVLHSFVRVKIESNNPKGSYLIAEIIGFEESANAYPICNTISNTYIQIKNATLSISLAIAYISNEQFKEIEFLKWIVDCEQFNVTLPNVEQVACKMKEITSALNYRVTDTDINNMVERKTALRQGSSNGELGNTSLFQDRNSNTYNGDNDDVVFLDEKIKEYSEFNCNRNRIMERRHTLIYTSSPYRTPRPVPNLYQSNSINPYDPYTRRPTRPHKVVTSVGNKDNDNFLIPSTPSR